MRRCCRCQPVWSRPARPAILSPPALSLTDPLILE
jgi:hypothetical protein